MRAEQPVPVGERSILPGRIATARLQQLDQARRVLYGMAAQAEIDVNFRFGHVLEHNQRAQRVTTLVTTG